VIRLGGAVFNATWKEYINKKTLASYFFISSGMALTFYLTFFHFIPVLKENFGYSPEDIIKHNLFLSFIPIITGITLTYLTCWIHPLRIQKIRATVGFLLIIFLPFLIMSVASPMHLFLVQSLILVFALEETPSIPVFYKHFPIYCRFMSATLMFALSRTFMTIVTSFGLIYLTSYFGHFGIWVVALPIGIAYLCGISHFIGLDRKLGVYPNLARGLLFGGRDPAHEFNKPIA